MSTIRRFSEELTSKKGLCIANRELYASFPIHWHEYYEIEYVISGSGTVIINNRKHHFQKNTVFFMTPSDMEEIDIDEKTVLINISFNNDWILNEISNHLSSGIVLYDYPTDLIFRIRDEYLLNDNWSSIYVKSLLNGVLIDIVRKLNESIYSSIDYAPLNMALRYLRIHFKEPITLNSVAEYINLSPSYLSTVFRKNIGVSFKSYLVNLRLQYAAKLLITSDLSVTNICYMSGFNDFANFLKSFKKHYNISPLKYKKKYLPEANSIVFSDPSHSFHYAETAVEIIKTKDTSKGYTVIQKKT